MKYHSLNLEAFKYKNEGGTESFSSWISKSPVGEMAPSKAVEVTLPADLRPRLRKLDKRRLSLQQMMQLGEDLADALFPHKLRAMLHQSLTSLSASEGLRIRLKLDSYALASIPWEYAYLSSPDTPPDQKDINGFLALDNKISLLRDLILQQPRREVEPVANQALRMVVLLSNPATTAELDLGTEQQNIHNALGEIGNIEVQYYPKATIDLLEAATRNNADIFHFSGHGRFELAPDGTEGQGFLSLTGSNGEESQFPVSLFAANLKRCGIRLAMLSMCESSRVDGVNAWTGFAPALMLAGIPAVVGMQFSVLDENAVFFSKAFYHALAEGDPIDNAVSAGRLAIINRADKDERDWGAPALYLRAEGDGILFPRAAYVAGKALQAAAERFSGKAPKAIYEKPTPQPPKGGSDDKSKAFYEKPPIKAPKAAEDRDITALFKYTFEATLIQLDVVVDYLALHDLLHDLGYSIELIAHESSVASDKLSLHSLRATALRVRRTTDRLREVVNKKKVSEREIEWVDILDKASSDIEHSIETPEPQKDLLNSALGRIGQVLSVQPTHINVSLMRAVEAFRFAELIEIVERVYESRVKSGNTESVQRIRQGVEALKTLNSDLSTLMKEYDMWVRSETRIPLMELSMHQPDAFQILWKKLKADIPTLHSHSEERWALDMKHTAEALNQACKDNNGPAVTELFERFSLDVRRRLVNVQREILKLCQQLFEIRTKMESI